VLYLNLFFEFLKTGIFSIGGGLATIPFLMEMGEKFGWFSAEELSNMIAVSESTPGPIGINMATYVGYTTGSAEFGVVGGVLGALVATTAIIIPSITVILIIAGFLQKFKENKLVKDTFYVLRPAVIGMLGVSLAAMITPLVYISGAATFLAGINYKAIILFVLLLIGILKFKKLHPIVFIGIGAAVGIIFKF